MACAEVNIKREKTASAVLAEARSRVVRALKYGGSLVLLLSDAAPRVRSQLSSPGQLPYALLADCEAVRGARGHSVRWKDVPWARALLTDEDEVYAIHEDFAVVAVTRLGEAEVREFLGDELPLDGMQMIRVTVPA